MGRNCTRAQVSGSWVHWVCTVDTCGCQRAPVCNYSDVSPEDATHMQQNGVRRFIAHMMALSGKSRAETKASLGCPEKKKNQCLWVLLWWGLPQALGLDGLNFPPAPRDGGRSFVFPVTLKWVRRGMALIEVIQGQYQEPLIISIRICLFY